MRWLTHQSQAAARPASVDARHVLIDADLDIPSPRPGPGYLADYAVYQPDEDVPDHNALVARFVGGEHQLRALHEILRTGAPMLALTGIGGVGKTQLAAEYIYRFRDEYDLIWWVPAEHTPSLRASLATLGTRLNLPRSGTMQQPSAQVLEELKKSTLLWLLVFDNARSPAHQPLIRPVATGKILVTSRDPDWRDVGPTLDIGVFEHHESVKLLRTRAATIEPRDADTVAEKVGDLPLAVDQVANWHVATGTPMSSLLTRLDDVLTDPGATAAGYPAPLAGALYVAFEQLTAAAAQLLELFAWLGAEPVWLALLRRGRQGTVAEPLRSALRQEPDINAAVRELRRHGLVTLLKVPGERLPMHRVFQSVLRDWLSPDRLARGRDNLRAILAAANPGEPDNPDFWPHYNEVGPHIHRADLAAASDFEVRRVVLDQARFLNKAGHYEESEALSAARHRGCNLDRVDLDDPESGLVNRNNIAVNYRLLGRSAEAYRIDSDLVREWEKEQRRDHPRASLARCNLARDLYGLGRYREAATLLADSTTRTRSTSVCRWSTRC